MIVIADLPSYGSISQNPVVDEFKINFLCNLKTRPFTGPQHLNDIQNMIYSFNFYLIIPTYMKSNVIINEYTNFSFFKMHKHVLTQNEF